jgi:hypothetical protein
MMVSINWWKKADSPNKNDRSIQIDTNSFLTSHFKFISINFEYKVFMYLSQNWGNAWKTAPFFQLLGNMYFKTRWYFVLKLLVNEGGADPKIFNDWKVINLVNVVLSIICS